MWVPVNTYQRNKQPLRLYKIEVFYSVNSTLSLSYYLVGSVELTTTLEVCCTVVLSMYDPVTFLLQIVSLCKLLFSELKLHCH